MTSRPFIAAAAALLLATLDAPSSLLAQSAPAGKPVIGAFGIDTAQMDTSVKPGDDFFKYVNGKWLATFKIPADKASYGAFDLLNDKAEEDVRNLLADLAKSRPAPGSVGQKVIDLYESWMEEAAKLLRDEQMHPVELREMVTSPGGTTIRAIHELEQAGVRAAFLNAIQAAMVRSRELAAGEP